MSALRRPKNLQDIVNVYENQYSTLRSLVDQDLLRARKMNHWIWYVFPQRRVPNAPNAHFELGGDQSADILMALYPDKYGYLLSALKDKPLEWYMRADRARVASFFANNPDLLAASSAPLFTVETSDAGPVQPASSSLVVYYDENDLPRLRGLKQSDNHVNFDWIYGTFEETDNNVSVPILRRELSTLYFVYTEPYGNWKNELAWNTTTDIVLKKSYNGSFLMNTMVLQRKLRE